ncbi:hypothetical protein ZIOFF_058890 [Zingiber officinale]|uniref:Uncharacterized protein n=1 Tax=Zingiber officinale TaxID=94328 RepID=A0A8J5FH69_ZINOF|nr:hypothetical protein ZIOFF_058890 [Zingiber officinale]
MATAVSGFCFIELSQNVCGFSLMWFAALISCDLGRVLLKWFWIVIEIIVVLYLLGCLSSGHEALIWLFDQDLDVLLIELLWIGEFFTSDSTCGAPVLGFGTTLPTHDAYVTGEEVVT